MSNSSPNPYSPTNVTATPALPSSGVPAMGGGGKFSPDFFKQFMSSRINPGTILTGVIEDDLSSGGSKKGETFAIILEDGYAVEGKELIPKGSRILGSVNNTTPARYRKHGMPGQITISLQTLVFPDGRTTNFNGFIDHNPNHLQESEPKTKFAGFNFSDYGQSLKGMLYSSVAGIGPLHKNMMKGKEFNLKKGTHIAVKVNRTIDLSAMKPGASGIPGLALGQPTVPGMVGGGQGFDPGGMPLVPGLTAPQGTGGGGVPGLVGAPGAPGTPGAPVIPGVNSTPFGTPGIPGLPGTQISPAAQFAGNQRYSVLPGHLGGDTPNTVPGLSLNNPPGMGSNLPGLGTNNAPGMTSNPVPGLGGNNGPTFGANNGSGFGSNFSSNFGNGGSNFSSNSGLVPGSGLVPDSDPNSIFKKPINAPKLNMADPF